MPINECCTDEVNKVEISKTKNSQGILITKVCVLCQRKHYELLADTISLGMDLKI